MCSAVHPSEESYSCPPTYEGSERRRTRYGITRTRDIPLGCSTRFRSSRAVLAASLAAARPDALGRCHLLLCGPAAFAFHRLGAVPGPVHRTAPVRRVEKRQQQAAVDEPQHHLGPCYRVGDRARLVHRLHAEPARALRPARRRLRARGRARPDRLGCSGLAEQGYQARTRARRPCFPARRSSTTRRASCRSSSPSPRR